MLKALGVWDRDVAQEGEPLCKLLRFASAVVWRSCSALFGHIRMPKGGVAKFTNFKSTKLLEGCDPTILYTISYAE